MKRDRGDGADLEAVGEDGLLAGGGGGKVKGRQRGNENYFSWKIFSISSGERIYFPVSSLNFDSQSSKFQPAKRRNFFFPLSQNKKSSEPN